VMLGWMVGETHFARPDEGFDRLAAEVEGIPGVTVDDRERWVEAPGFSDPSSWMALDVDAAALPELLATACATAYADPVSWSFRIRADAGTVVVVHGDQQADGRGGSRCPDPGFDVAGLVARIGGIVPGMEVQPTVGADGGFGLVAREDGSAGVASLLPLVAHADELRDAAGLDPGRSVEVQGGLLGVTVAAGEQDLYVALLADLVDEHGVTSFWADDGSAAVDGVAVVQVVAPQEERAAVEDRIRASGLRIAGSAVRFLPPEP
jgi:hypothetical protein